MVFLDSAATTPISNYVLNEMMPYLTTEYGNPGGKYSLGKTAADAVQHAREQVAEFFNCEPENIVFTSGGSDGNNLVLKGSVPYLKKIRRYLILTTKAEHDSILNAVSQIDEQNASMGYDYIPILEDGTVDFETMESIMKYTVKFAGLVSVMYVNNELGSTNDVKRIAEFAHSNGALFHTDCVQAAGCIPIDVQEIGCDFATISAHKIHGPKGVGAIYVKDRSKLSPLISGGADQEFGLRGGTENVSGIVGLGASCELYKGETGIKDLNSLFLECMKATFYSHGLDGTYTINHAENKVINVRFDGVDAQTLVMMLDSCGVAVSAGSACTSNSTEPSHVLIACGLSSEHARESIRISFDESMEIADFAIAMERIAECVERLRSIT